MFKHLFSLWICVALIAGTAAFSFYKIEDVQQHQNDAIHSIICFSENFITHSKKLTPQKKREDLHIYDRMAAVAHLKPCS